MQFIITTALVALPTFFTLVSASPTVGITTRNQLFGRESGMGSLNCCPVLGQGWTPQNVATLTGLVAQLKGSKDLFYSKPGVDSTPGTGANSPCYTAAHTKDPSGTDVAVVFCNDKVPANQGISAHQIGSYGEYIIADCNKDGAGGLEPPYGGIPNGGTGTTSGDGSDGGKVCGQLFNTDGWNVILDKYVGLPSASLKALTS